MSQIFTYQCADNLRHHGRLGLLVLQTDETIEHDFQRLLPAEQASIYVSRVPSSPTVNADTLSQMANELTASAALLPQAIRYDAIGYGCTSASSVIGSEKVEQLVQQGCDTPVVTNPLRALLAACEHLGIKRLAFLTPYAISVSEHLRARVNQAGIETPVFGTFNEAVEEKVVRIADQSIIDAAVSLGSHADCDGLFMSCTNLRTLNVIETIESKINKPVLSSNLVLAWHMAQLAGLDVQQNGYGRLWK